MCADTMMVPLMGVAEQGLYLDSIEVQVCPVGAGGNAGGGAAAHANPVGRPADLDNQHADAWVLLVQVVVVYLAQPATAQALGNLS